MLTYLMALLAFYLPGALYPISSDVLPGFLLIIFLMTFVIPVLGVSFFRIFGNISSFIMEDRRERIYPFFFTSLFYLIVTYLFYSKTRIGLDDNLLKILMIVDALVVVSAVITLFYKISVHSLAVCGILGILLPLNRVAVDSSLFYPTLTVVVIAGAVMSSRLQLNAHSIREVLVGAVVGITTGLCGMIYLF
jgi:hypothetical protein